MPKKIRIGHPRNVRISGDGTNFSLVGQVANLRKITAVVAAMGAYSLAGQSATLSTSSAGTSDPIAESRRITWEPGVRGGIPERNTIFQTLNPGATLTQINTALTNCPSGQVVMLAAGTYNLGTGAIVIPKSNITLRGAGGDQTKLFFNGRGNVNGIQCSIGFNGPWIQGSFGTTPQNEADWTAGFSKNSNVLTFSNTANLAIGTMVLLDQLHDTTDSDGMYVCGEGQVCGYTSHGGDNRTNRFQRQFVEVISINGSQVTVRPGIHMPNWDSSKQPKARWATGTITYSGVEDLSIDLNAANNTTGQQANIGLIGTRDCWVRGIRSVMGDRAHIQVYQSHRTEIRDNYIYGSFNGVQTSYGLESFGGSCDFLWENNIFQHNTNPLIINDGGSGGVAAYNFSIDNFRSSPTELMVATFQVHSPGTGMILVEGNDGLAVCADNWYGTVNFVTFHRNHLYGDIYNNPPKSQQTWIMQIAAYSRFFNFTGNVLGRTGYYNTYQAPNLTASVTAIWNFGYSHANGGVTDAQTLPRAMRWGNYDTVTGTSRFESSEIPSGLTSFANPVPSNQTLPTSYFRSSKPDWFGLIPWPAVGPDVSGGNVSGYAGHANKIPARVAYESMSNDSAYGSTPVKVFNRETLYPSSIWSGNTITAASANRADVQTAVNAAVDGDIVEIPAGSVTWTSGITINKAIWLRGAGNKDTGTTTINSNTASGTTLDINGVAANRGYIKVSGIWFVGSSGAEYTGAHLQISPVNGTQNIRITECYFTGHEGWSIAAGGCGTGNNTGYLIDNCRYRNGFWIKATADGFYGWLLPLNQGSGAYLYIEDCVGDNTTQYGPATGWTAVDLFDGARVCMRYTTLVGGYFGTHDVARAGQYVASGRAWEIYNNTISNQTDTLFKGLDITAGSGVAFNNTFNGSITHPVGLFDYKTDDNRGIGACNGTQNEDQNVAGQSGWICQFQVGSRYANVTGLPLLDSQFNSPYYEGNWGQFAVSDPAYFWNNTYNGSTTLPVVTGANSGTHIQNGRDYFANTQKSGYTPYTYPHPLRSI